MEERIVGLARSVLGGLIARETAQARSGSKAQTADEYAAAASLPLRPSLRQRIGRRLLRSAKPFLLPLVHRYERILYASLERTAIGTIDHRLDAIEKQLKEARIAAEKRDRELDRILQGSILPVGDGTILVRHPFGLVLVPANKPGLIEASAVIEPLAQGVYETIRPLLQLGSTVVDMGAGFGQFTLFALHTIGPEGRVVALEPNPKTAALLQRTLHLNGIANRVDLIEPQPGATRLPEGLLPNPAMITLVRLAGDAAGIGLLRDLRRLAETNPRLATVVEFEAGAPKPPAMDLPECIAMVRALGFEPWQIDARRHTIHPLRGDGAAAVEGLAMLLLCCPPTDFPGLGLA